VGLRFKHVSIDAAYVEKSVAELLEVAIEENKPHGRVGWVDLPE
jgi:hypothetical protein